MNNKGFTLVELLAVIAILSVLVLITGTAVTKMLSDAKEDLSSTQIQLIKSAAESWSVDNINKLPSVGECSYITLGDLKAYGLLDDDIKDAKTGNKISDDLAIKIISKSNKYGDPITIYEVAPDSVDGCSKAIKPICELVSGTGTVTVAEYICSLDADRTFYVLGENASDSNKIDLIMASNYVDDTVPITMSWCALGGNYNSCNHDNLDIYIEHIQQVFGNSVEVNLPTGQQIATAGRDMNWRHDSEGTSMQLPQWLWGNLYSSSNTSLPYGYWTSTAYPSQSTLVWTVNYSGTLTNYPNSGSSELGLRPVITISKSNLD